MPQISVLAARSLISFSDFFKSGSVDPQLCHSSRLLALLGPLLFRVNFRNSSLISENKKCHWSRLICRSVWGHCGLNGPTPSGLLAGGLFPYWVFSFGDNVL